MTTQQTAAIATLTARVAALEGQLLRVASYKDVLAALAAGVASAEITPVIDNKLHARVNDYMSHDGRDIMRSCIDRLAREAVTTKLPEIVADRCANSSEFGEAVARHLSSRAIEEVDYNVKFVEEVKKAIKLYLNNKSASLIANAIQSAVANSIDNTVSTLAQNRDLHLAMTAVMKPWFDNYVIRREVLAAE